MVLTSLECLGNGKDNNSVLTFRHCEFRLLELGIKLANSWKCQITQCQDVRLVLLIERLRTTFFTSANVRNDCMTS